MHEIYISNEEFLHTSVQNFRKVFPNEEACLRVFPAKCRLCGWSQSEPETTVKRQFTCERCKNICWRTAGTFFHGLKYLLPTFLLIWLYEDRAIFTTLEFSRLADICYSTAWETNENVKAVINHEMDTDHNLFQAVTTLFDPVICKRSSQTPAGAHPSIEGVIDDPELDPDIVCDDQRTVFETLSQQPKTADKIHTESGLPVGKVNAALALLEIFGFIKRLCGDCYVLKKTVASSGQPLTHAQKGSIRKFFRYIKSFHGVSRKYLQRYTASFWAIVGWHRWGKGSLLKTCMDYRRLSRAEILAYNSPQMVRIIECK